MTTISAPRITCATQTWGDHLHVGNWRVQAKVTYTYMDSAERGHRYILPFVIDDPVTAHMAQERAVSIITALLHVQPRPDIAWTVRLDLTPVR